MFDPENNVTVLGSKTYLAFVCSPAIHAMSLCMSPSTPHHLVPSGYSTQSNSLGVRPCFFIVTTHNALPFPVSKPHHQLFTKATAAMSELNCPLVSCLCLYTMNALRLLRTFHALCQGLLILCHLSLDPEKNRTHLGSIVTGF